MMGIREQPGEVDVERGQLVEGCVVRQLGCNQPGEARSGHVSYVCRALVRGVGGCVSVMFGVP